MSTFRGRVAELPNVSIDRFDRENLKSSCFFLSHCHTDHMHGLDDYSFTQLLRRNENYFIFCSSISALIIRNMGLDISKDQIKEIRDTTKIHVPESDSVPVPYDVTVTCLSAGHCPGSVMYLFETINNTILYTGDFRFAKGDSTKFKLLRNSEWVKTIDKVYFDATFLNEDYWEFPSRYESVEEIIRLIRDWFKYSPENQVHLETCAKYGYEYVFQELSKTFRCKIYVNASIYDLYCNVPEIGSVLTKESKTTRIYVHGKSNDNLHCERHYVLHIKLSAQFYRWKKGKSKPAISNRFIKEGRKHAQVCFSTHSSCSELIDFLNFLKPKEVHACTDVVRRSEEEKQNYLLALSSTWHKKDEDGKIITESRNTFNSFENVSLSNTPVKIKIMQEEKETHNNLLDSPPIRKQRLSLNASVL